MSNLPKDFRNQAYSLMDMEIAQIEADMTSHCESPIEVAFAAAFLLLGRYSYGHIGFLPPGDDYELNKIEYEFALAAQRHILNYRVDFVAYWNAAPERQRIVIECDGHNFHERTKEQAAKDRSRDRALQQAGFRVFRFTGSEIYRDAFKCAAEVLESLCSMMDDDTGAGK
jgi:very-short-patch-repair endonuclease